MNPSRSLARTVPLLLVAALAPIVGIIAVDGEAPGRLTRAAFSDETGAGSASFVASVVTPGLCVLYAEDGVAGAATFSSIGGTVNGCVRSNGDFTLSGRNAVVDGDAFTVLGTEITRRDATLTGTAYIVPAEAKDDPYGLDAYLPTAPGMQRFLLQGQYLAYVETSVLDLNLLPDGIYYVVGDATIQGNAPLPGTAKSVTVVATGAVTMAANGWSLSPFHDGLLVMSDSMAPDAISIAGGSLDLSGRIQALDGGITMPGSNNAFTGQMHGGTIEIGGSSNTLTAA